MAETEIAIWRDRASQARRVAGMLSGQDARLLEEFAVECDERVRWLVYGTGAASGQVASRRQAA
jgi:hypothetical protein